MLKATWKTKLLSLFWEKVTEELWSTTMSTKVLYNVKIVELKIFNTYNNLITEKNLKN